MAARISRFRSFWMVFMAVLLYIAGTPRAKAAEDEIQDITGKYHFLTADDTLALLEEEGVLKGYIDIYQSEDESDAILSYNILQGSRKKDRVEFRTNEIHRKYYRFSGKVERGPGHEEVDPDYMRLVGDLEIITVRGVKGEPSVQRMHVLFKSMGKSEGEEN